MLISSTRATATTRSADCTPASSRTSNSGAVAGNGQDVQFFEAGQGGGALVDDGDVMVFPSQLGRQFRTHFPGANNYYAQRTHLFRCVYLHYNTFSSPKTGISLLLGGKIVQRLRQAIHILVQRGYNQESKQERDGSMS